MTRNEYDVDVCYDNETKEFDWTCISICAI